MSIKKYWERLQADPMGGWLRPVDPPSLALDAQGRIIWCGIGGSLLPADSLVRMFGDPTQVSRWVILSSPESIPGFDLRSSDQVVLVSKSGSTLELWAWIGKLLQHPQWSRITKIPLVITQPNGNPLHQLATNKKWILIAFPDDVGGRYSVFTPVGYLPLIWLGKNASCFAQSGRNVVQQMCDGRGLWFEHILHLTRQWLMAYREDVSDWVFMPYSRQLRFIGGWWTQLVSESLGKIAIDGTPRGITAIRAVGPQDQHAQLQRWLAGPKNIGVIFLSLRHATIIQKYCIQPPESPVSFLSMHTGEEILRAQILGTKIALNQAGVRTYEIELDSMDEIQLGALMMAWQIIVALVGYGLEINPFDQPEIELGKRKTIDKLLINLNS